MRSIYRSLVLAPVLLATSAFAATTTVKVPFDFVAQGHAYHAGSYEISNETTTAFLTVTNHEKPAESFKIAAGAGGELNDKVKLKFDVVGKTHVLNAIQYGPLVNAKLNNDKKHGNVDHSSMATGR